MVEVVEVGNATAVADLAQPKPLPTPRKIGLRYHLSCPLSTGDRRRST
jgi:hypothetical protein